MTVHHGYEGVKEVEGTKHDEGLKPEALKRLPDLKISKGSLKRKSFLISTTLSGFLISVGICIRLCKYYVSLT